MSEHPQRFARLFPWLALPSVAGLLLLVAMVPMTWQQQAGFGGAMVVAALLINRRKQGDVTTLLLVLLCLCATTRYAYWRGATLWGYLRSPWSHVSIAAAALMLILLAAEFYTFIILLLGFVQTVRPLRRPPVLLPDDVTAWPTVDVFIPTFNESLDVVRYTVLAAAQMDWPVEKLNIYLLDDGGRASFRRFAAEAGIHYIARKEHSGAKAGNLNHALRQTRGEFVTIFDCDHIPTRSFLQISLGWFLQDRQLGMLQTPHHFYSPDPFEKNLGKFRKLPNEGNLFYGIVQDANDLWNATFFCGSCAVLRRSGLEMVGGIAQDTVTEDAHTSLRMQKAGWGTAYINIPQAAGLATETLARHVKQRIRWARGMVQILRTDNPLLGRGLRLTQRLCYFNATLHFLYALPRLIFLTAPLLFLLFGLSNVPGYWLAILSFALPHLAMTTITNSRIQGSHRFSFWNEIYETVLSPYLLLPTLVALVKPSAGSFNVTDKGGAQEHGYFDAGLATPFLVLLVLNISGIAMAVPRYLYWDPEHTGTLAVNVFWALFNVVILGVALSVCVEQRQRRNFVRVNCQVPLRLRTSEETVEATTLDMAAGGLAAMAGTSWMAGEAVEIEFSEEPDDERLTGKVVATRGDRLQIRFDPLSLPQQRLLTKVLYARADRWLSWDETYETDHPFRSLLSVLAASAHGFYKLLFALPGKSEASTASSLKPVRTTVIGAVLLAALLLVAWRAHASPLLAPKPEPPATVVRSFTLGSLATGSDTLLLDQPGGREILRFATPQSWLIRGGTLHLKYQIPHDASSIYTYADVRLNDSILASVTPSAEEREQGAGELEVPLPADLLTARNQIVIQLAGEGNSACALPAQKSPSWLRIDPSSQVVLNAQPLLLASELGALPQPFLEHLANQPVVLPMVFAHAPDTVTLAGAGVLASYFGSLADDSGVRFSTRVGDIPTGNAIVLLVGGEQLGSEMPASNAGSSSSVSLEVNPQDPYGKLLVLRGQTSHALLALAQGLTTGQVRLSGSRAMLMEPPSFPAREPNDAPRWIHNERVSLDSLLTPAELHTAGQGPVTMYLHLAPDYNFGVQQNMYLHLAYAVTSPELAHSSNAAAVLNGVQVGSEALTAQAKPKQTDISLADGPAAVYANTLQVQFFFVPAGADPCAPGRGNSSAQILGSSYLDLNGAVHYIQLPNLQLFSKAGYPFTRMADLSQTTVLLPLGTAPEVAALYLDLMGYFGAQTGYPALHVEVATGTDTSRLAGRDVLALGTFADLANLPALNAQLPLHYQDAGLALSARAQLGLMVSRLEGRFVRAWQGEGDPTNFSADGLVEGTASPFGSGRSLVVIASRDLTAMPALASSLLTTMPLDGIDSSVSVWHDGKFSSFALSTETYGLGNLPWYLSFRYWLPQHVLVLLLLLLVGLVLLSVWTDRWLSLRVSERLGLEKRSEASTGNGSGISLIEAP